MRVPRSLLIVFLAVSCLVGCQRGPVLHLVSGTVTVDGQPLAEGFLYFVTVATGDIEPVTIKDGKFQGVAKPGDRRVEISALKTIKVDGGMGSEIKENILPKCYHSESILTAQVTAKGPNQFSFDLKTSGESTSALGSRTSL